MAAAVWQGGEVLSSVIHEQHAVHRPYGGVVPELASRDHIRHVSQVVDAALDDAGVAVGELGGIGVTAGPGLIGSLLVGLCFGKALAYRMGVPVVGVHHLIGHLVSAELEDPSLRPPYLGLVVSGGHTALYRIEADGAPKLMGETRDDAVGEAFDKVAKLLGLAYPGGPAIACRGRVPTRPTGFPAAAPLALKRDRGPRRPLARMGQLSGRHRVDGRGKRLVAGGRGEHTCSLRPWSERRKTERATQATRLAFSNQTDRPPTPTITCD